MSGPRVVFLGTPEFAVPSLRAVARACTLVGVVTRPDRPRGRGRETGPSAVAAAASELGIEAWKPEKPNAPESRERLAGLSADLFAVVAFGAILSPELLRTPRLGCINLHGSLLPDYRGASPVQRALQDGRTATGVSTLWMDEGIDTGDVILQQWIAIEPADNSATLGARLADLGAPLLAESLRLAHAGTAPRHVQDRSAGSYAPRLSKWDGAVDWMRDVETVWNHQRAVTPWPGAAARFRERRLTLIQTRPRHRLAVAEPPGSVIDSTAEGVAVACRPGALLVTRVKPEGRAEMTAADWARGARLERGESLIPEKEKEAHA